MNPAPHRLFHTLILVGTSAAACGGSVAPDGSGGAGGARTNAPPTSGPEGGSSTGGSSSETGTGGLTGGSERPAVPDVPLDQLPCPPEQWRCDGACWWPSSTTSCTCDLAAPITAADCGADEDFACFVSEYDGQGTPLGGEVRWSCRCEPRTEACCSDAAREAEAEAGGASISAVAGCNDGPSPREVTCGCLVLLR